MALFSTIELEPGLGVEVGDVYVEPPLNLATRARHCAAWVASTTRPKSSSA